jgi:biofilm PGA synthesis N-glycosyltransferase PgaC
MNLGTVTFYFFALASTLYILHFGFYLVGANVYDVWQNRLRHKRFKAAIQGVTVNYKPLITVVISAHNEEKVIVRCLESIEASTYKNVQILAVDDGSSDKTRLLASRYKRNHPEAYMHVLYKIKNGGKGAALNHALKRYAKGELVMTLDADSILRTDAIERAVAYFEDPKIVGVSANVKAIDDFTVLGMLQKFEFMVGYRSKKVYSMVNCEFVIGGVGSTYRMSTLRKVNFYSTGTMTEDIGLSIKVVNLGNRTNRIVYGSDIVVMTEGVEKFKALVKQRFRWKYGSLQNIFRYRHLIGNTNFQEYTFSLTFYRMPLALLSEIMLLFAPITWGYVLYWTIIYASLRLVLGAYLTISIYILITVWFDENSSIKDRLLLSMYVPIAYFIFYVMDVVQLIAVVKCLRRGHKLLRNEDSAGHWVSPTRIGHEVTAT